MKKSLLTILIIALNISVFIAQDEFNKTSIVEHFTNTRCPSCSSANPGFYSLLKKQNNYIHVAYHPRYPYSSCVFYKANPEGNMIKTDFYSISGTPQGVFNGQSKKSISSVSQSDFDQQHSEKSPVLIDVKVENDQFNFTITNNAYNLSGADFRLFVMMVEDPINYNAPNGENIHHNVFRNWLSSTSGEVIGEQQKTISLSKRFDNVENLDNAKIIAYVQDINSKKIYNAVESSTITSLKEQVIFSKVYPTIASNELTIEVENINTSFKIINSLGQIVDQRILTTYSTIIDLSQFDSGQYYAILKSQEGDINTQYFLIK